MQHPREKMLHSFDDLSKRRHELDSKTKENIVLTSGCFDLLHGGHLEYLCDASKYGFLIVGVNSDAFVRRLKGLTRPIRGQDDRLFTIAGLEPVELAIIFNDDIELIQAARPHVYIASQTSNTRVWDDGLRLQTLRNMNVTVIELPACKKESTTNIIGRARNAFVQC